MSWLESQIEMRARLDSEMTERAYAELATSVVKPGKQPLFALDDLEQADSAVKACLKYNDVEPGPVPEGENELMARIDWLCRPSGTMHRNVTLDAGWHRRAFGALLGQLETGEPIALLPWGMSGYYYRDPASGKKVRVDARTAGRIRNEAIFFYCPFPAKPLGVRDLAEFIFEVFDRDDYLLVFIAALAVTLIGLLPAYANKIAFGTVVPSGQASLIMPVAALLFGVMASSVLIEACRNIVMARVSTKLDLAIEAATFSRVLALPPSFFKDYASGDLASRVSNMTQLARILSSVLLGTGLSSVLSLVYIFQVAAFTPQLALPALLIVLVQAGFTVVATRLVMSYELATMEASSKLSGVVTALLNGIQKIKLAGAEDRAFAKWAHGYSEYARARYNRPAVLQALPAVVTLLGLVGTVAIYYLAGISNVSIADYMAFNVAYGQVTAAIMALAGAAGQFAQLRPMAEMVEPILKATPEMSDDKPSVEDLAGSIEVSGVSFRYGPDQPYVLDGLSFKVRPGEYVGVVGKSGCGKSTIMRLLLGFEKPDRGTILFGYHDVQKVDLRSLRQHIGVVMQSGSLFMGDIFSNITISAPLATLDDAWEAAEIAGIADDIRKMPMGMHTLVTEGGGGISGGQRQRIMIARAVCGGRRILMFDEATSALDNKTQRHVSDSLDKLNCTRFVIAHRLSTVRHCDRILVIDGGKVAEEGTYEELIARDGIFTELVRRQRLDS